MRAMKEQSIKNEQVNRSRTTKGTKESTSKEQTNSSWVPERIKYKAANKQEQEKNKRTESSKEQKHSSKIHLMTKQQTKTHKSTEHILRGSEPWDLAL